MLRIEARHRAGAAQRRPAGASAEAWTGTRDGEARALALVAAEPADSHAERRLNGRSGAVRPLAGFIAHLIASTDPSVRPSRAERALGAAARYAEAARLTA